jgi:hypothetical protein
MSPVTSQSTRKSGCVKRHPRCRRISGGDSRRRGKKWKDMEEEECHEN